MIISLKDGSIKTIFKPRDFCDLVDEYMGFDAYRYIDKVITELREAADYTELKLDTDLTANEVDLGIADTCFRDISEIVKQMELTLAAPRINRAKLTELVREIDKEGHTQI